MTPHRLSYGGSTDPWLDHILQTEFWDIARRQDHREQFNGIR